MPYEESLRHCPNCGRPTWHGREVPDVHRSYWLAVVSHMITVYTDLLVRWTCLDCGRKGRSTAVKPGEPTSIHPRNGCRPGLDPALPGNSDTPSVSAKPPGRDSACFAAMRNVLSKPLSPVLMILAGILILKVTVEVVSNYHNYYPPNFGSDFLRGREHDFSSAYRWAFYTHIASGPVSLVLGMILIGERFRRRFPRWHRYLGRIQVACVLLLVAPSGLWMAQYAAAGPIAAVGLAALAFATGMCAVLGWRSAIDRRFADHRRWMWRVYLLLCSAVVLRLIGGLATVTGFGATWIDPPATWLSWLVPLTAFELSELGKRNARRPMKMSSRVP